MMIKTLVTLLTQGPIVALAAVQRIFRWPYDFSFRLLNPDTTISFRLHTDLTDNSRAFFGARCLLFLVKTLIVET